MKGETTFLPFKLLCFPLPFARPVDTTENQGGSGEAYPGDGFAQYQGGANHGKYRIQVDIVRGAQGAQVVHHYVPYRKANERSQDAQEKEVHQHFGLQEARQGELPGVDPEGRQDGEHAVEEHLAGDEEAGVAAAQPADDEAVEGPREGGQQGEKVAQRIEPQDKAAVVDHQGNAQQGNERPDEQVAAGRFPAVEGQSQKGGQQRGGADNERDIGGQGDAQGGVFGQEIERTASDAGSHHPGFVAPGVGQEAVGGNEPDAQVGDEEAEQEDFLR